MQKEMPFFFKTSDLKLLDEKLIQGCKDGHDAIKLCFDQRSVRYSQATVAAACEIDGGHFTCILQGIKHMPSSKRVRFMQVCGNLAPVQFEAMHLGLSFRKESIQEKAERLEKENIELREKLIKSA